MGRRRYWRFAVTLFLSQSILAAQPKVIIHPTADGNETAEVSEEESCEFKWAKAMKEMTDALCGNCHKHTIRRLAKKCSNVTVPGKPKIIMPSNPHEGEVIDGEHFLRPTWGLPMFRMEVSWEHPPDSGNLLGYRVRFALGKKGGHGGEIFYISKDINSVIFGLDPPTSDSVGNSITLRPRYFFKTDFGTGFMGSGKLLYSVEVLSLPIRDIQRTEKQTDAVSFELPGCDAVVCSCLQQRLRSNGMERMSQSCALDGCEDMLAVKTVELCPCRSEAVPANDSNCSILRRPSKPSHAPPVTPSATPASTTMLTISATETVSSGEEGPVGVRSISASVVAPSAIAVAALIVAALCLALVFAWQRSNAIGKRSCKNPGWYPQDSKGSSVAFMECAVNGKFRLNSSVSTVLTDTADMRPMPDPVVKEDCSLIALTCVPDGPGIYVSYSRYTSTSRSDAARLCSELRRHGFRAILDIYQENSVSDDRQSWITDHMMESSHVIVLLDRTHPLNMTSAADQARLKSDHHNSCRDAILESDILRSCHYSGKSSPCIIPVCIGTVTGRDAVVPPMLRAGTVYRLPHDFDAGSCRWFQQLTIRLLSSGTVACLSEEL